jgi:predicted DNA-binding protein
MSTQMIIRIDDTIKAKFAKFAKAEGKTTSHVVRELIHDYVQDRDMGGYVDALWSRIGANLTAQGAAAKSVARAVQAARRAKR